jgi:carboxymethylenebutenolidase
MSEWVELKAADGHELSAYVAKPKAEPLGAVIVIQEIFGVNQSIRSVADEYARHDFVAIAPALFDRFGKSIELGYTGDDLKQAYELYGKLNPDTQLLDVAAAAEHVAGTGKGTGVIGFCYGGLLTWLSATRAKALKIDLKAAVGFYAGGIGKFAAETPTCPVQLHFGADDDHIGKDQIDAVHTAHPDVEIFLYEGAGHAFANEARPSYVPAASKLAHERALEFLKSNIAK